MLDWTSIAGVAGADKITQIHIRNLLLSHDIKSTMEGSLAFGVLVLARDSIKATKLLRLDASKRGYNVWFGINDAMRAVGEREPIVIRTAVSSILKQPKFSRNTALGKFLRSKELSKLTTKYPYISKMSVRYRRYLETPMMYATGYEVEIGLQKSLREQDGGYRGSYQVYEGGRGIRFIGSNEWKVNT